MAKKVTKIEPVRQNVIQTLRPKKRVCAYCRVSTGHEEQQNSLKNQIEFYTEYIQRNPYWRFVAVYYDTASGLRKNHLAPATSRC